LYTVLHMQGPQDSNYLYHAPFGPVAFRIKGDRLAGIEFLPDLFFNPTCPETHLTQAVREYLDSYFGCEEASPCPPLLIEGTPFQKRVWRALINIPPGEVRTYGQLAKELRTSSRAVAQACRRNRLAIIIPCHRVIAANGIGGFMGRANKVEIKSWLLGHEGVHVH